MSKFVFQTWRLPALGKNLDLNFEMYKVIQMYPQFLEFLIFSLMKYVSIIHYQISTQVYND